MLKAIQALVAAAVALALCTTIVVSATIPTASSFVIAIGETTAIYGVRGDCKGPAPSWQAVRPYLPEAKFGTFSNGGTGTLPSGSCGGDVSARVILYTGTRLGKETLLITTDRITVQVL